MMEFAREKGIHRFEWVNTRADGTDIFTEITLASITLNDKPAIYCVWRDITERKQNEEKIAQYAETQSALLREVNHRVKNNLTAIIGILHKEEDRICSEYPENNSASIIPLQEVVGRISGLLTVHRLLSSTRWSPLSLTQLSESIINGAMKGAPVDKTIHLDVDSSDIRIDSDQAHNLAIVLNELATNTMKYAFNGRDAIRIQVTFQLQGDSVSLLYCDDGPGFPDPILRGEIQEKSIGISLITGIVARSLQGEVELFNDNGAITRIVFPS